MPEELSLFVRVWVFPFVTAPRCLWSVLRTLMGPKRAYSSSFVGPLAAIIYLVSAPVLVRHHLLEKSFLPEEMRHALQSILQQRGQEAIRGLSSFSHFFWFAFASAGVVFGAIPVFLAFALGPLYAWAATAQIRDKKKETHGSAGWGKFPELPARFVASAKQESTICILGTSPSGWGQAKKKVGTQGHILTCAPTGAGKSIGCAIPNLWSYAGSAVVLDIKGELAQKTSAERASMGQDIFVVDPFSVVSDTTHAFNPLAHLNPRQSDGFSEASQIVDALVIRDSHGGDSYWDDAASDLLKGLVLYVADKDQETGPQLTTVREYLSLDTEHFAALLLDMTESPIDAVRRVGQSMRKKHEREFSSVVSSAQRHTAFLDDPCIAKTLAGNDFSFSHLKKIRATVYLVIPPHKLGLYRRWARLLLGSALVDMARHTQQGEPQTLFLLDEFPKLGHMSCVQEGLSVLRGYGVCFWILVQDLSQLKTAYPQWRTFLANTTLQVFGIQDLDTASYVSSLLGQSTRPFQTSQSGRSQSAGKNSSWSHNTSVSHQVTTRPLLEPSALREMSSEEVIVFLPGQRPLQLHRLNAIAQLERRAEKKRNK